MVRNILLTLWCAIFAIGGMSAAPHDCEAPQQNGKSRKEMFREIQNFKMKYLAQEMNLEDDQKQPFFTLYEEMSKKRYEVMRSTRKLERQVKKDENATEADYQAVSEAINKAKIEDAAISKEYDEKFSKFLSQKQIFKMKSAEESFRKKMEEMRHKGNGRHGKN